jgi:hypothetical protein
MLKYYCYLLLFILSVTGISQTSTPISIKNIGTVNVTEAIKSDLGIKVENIEPPSPDGNSTRSMLLRKKSEIEKKYPRGRANFGSRDITAEDTLKVGKGFSSNLTAGTGNPSDNSMAISNDGIVISAFNSAVYIRDTKNDTTLGELTLNQFSSQIGMNFDNFDPKTIYDPENDRFILIYLAGRTISNSFIVVCFSETNDPMGNWNVYSLSGNPLNDDSWSDYPAISMTKEETFITINLLRQGGPWQTSFKQTVIWQIDKYTGYSGNTTMSTKLWSGIQEGGINLRNMHPVRGGFDLKSTEQYFLSNRNFADKSDSIYLIKIDNTIASVSANLTIQLLQSDMDYYLGPTARQIGTNVFTTNDSRVLGGIIENEKIQFVQNSLDPVTGSASVFHGVISDLSGSPKITARIVSDTGVDFGYPNIVYGGLTGKDDKSVIGFNHSGLYTTAGHSAVYFDGNTFSKVKRVKEGVTRVGFSSFGDTVRWGDYIGIQRKYNEPCRVWMSGYFGFRYDNKSWVSELILPGDCFDTLTEKPYVENTLFPNPSIFQSELHFTLDENKEIKVDLTDSQGKVIRILYEDLAKKGENRIIINTQNLAIGIYYIRVYSENTSILVKKLLRQ